jgi:hypothetical protein
MRYANLILIRQNVEHRLFLNYYVSFGYVYRVELYRKGRGRRRGTDFTIQPSGYIDRKYMVETLRSMIV